MRIRRAVANIGSVIADPSLPLAKVQKKRQALHACRRRECQGQSNDPAHRVSGDMEAIDTLRIHDRQRVGGHRFDRELTVANGAPPNPAIVERDQRVAIAQRLDLRPPGIANCPDALNEQDRRPLTGPSVME